MGVRLRSVLVLLGVVLGLVASSAEPSTAVTAPSRLGARVSGSPSSGVPQWGAEPVVHGTVRPYNAGSELLSVSCPNPENCVAFGDHGDGPGDSLALVARLRPGKAWRALRLSQAGLRPPAGDHHEGFVPSVVRCASTSNCVALGSYADARGLVEGMAETESDGRWLATTTSLAGLSPRPGANPHVVFDDLACPEAGYCAALGTYADKSSQDHSFIDVLAKGKWTAHQPSVAALSPAAGKAGAPALDALSCWAAYHCVAVGSYNAVDGRTRGVAVAADGLKWVASTLSPGGLSPAPAADPDTSLEAVQCPSPDRCVAVGTYEASEDEVIGLSEVWTDKTWSAASLPIGGLVPAPAGTVTTTPSKLSCPTANFCVTVGTYRDLYGDLQGFADTYTAGKWTAWALPTYAFSPPAKARSVFAITGLDCPSAGTCMAVGYYAGASNEAHGFVEQLGHGLWDGLTPPLGGLAPPAGAFPGSQLDDVDCPASGFCVAVGTYSSPSGTLEALAEVFGG